MIPPIYSRPSLRDRAAGIQHVVMDRPELSAEGAMYRIAQLRATALASLDD